MFTNFIFPINFNKNITKNSKEYRKKKKKIILSKCKSKTY